MIKITLVERTKKLQPALVYETNMKKNLQKTSYSMLNSLVNAMFTIFNDKKIKYFCMLANFQEFRYIYNIMLIYQ